MINEWTFKELQCRLHLNCINFTESVYRITISLPVCETTGSVVPPSPRLLTHWLPDTVLNVCLTILWLIPSPVSVDCFSTRPDIPPCQTLQLVDVSIVNCNLQFQYHWDQSNKLFLEPGTDPEDLLHLEILFQQDMLPETNKTITDDVEEQMKNWRFRRTSWEVNQSIASRDTK